MIVKYLYRDVSIDEWEAFGAPEDVYLLQATYLDTGEKLTDAELDDLLQYTDQHQLYMETKIMQADHNEKGYY